MEASELPMSVLIVGIGDVPFTTMYRLEEDTKNLCQSGRKSTRQMVQFVSFKNILDKYDETSGGFQLAKQLLVDLPEHLVTYMKMKEILPKSKEILSSLN